MLSRANADREWLRGGIEILESLAVEKIRSCLGGVSWGRATRDEWERDRWAWSRVARRGNCNHVSPGVRGDRADRSPMAVSPS